MDFSFLWLKEVKFLFYVNVLSTHECLCNFKSIKPFPHYEPETSLRITSASRTSFRATYIKMNKTIAILLVSNCYRLPSSNFKWFHLWIETFLTFCYISKKLILIQFSNPGYRPCVHCY